MNGDIFLMAAVALGALGVILGIAALVRVRAISGRFSWLTDKSSVDSLPKLLAAVENNGRDVRELQDAFQQALVEARTHFKRMSIVRYNAFDGVAGQQGMIQQDGMHPTYQGIKRIVTGISPAVTQALQER